MAKVYHLTAAGKDALAALGVGGHGEHPGDDRGAA